MDLFTFTAHFTSDDSCRLHFELERDKQGLNCKSCGHKEQVELRM